MRPKRRSVLVALAAPMAGCLGTESEPSPTTEIDQELSVSNGSPASTAAVRMSSADGGTFDPQITWIEPGGTVVWRNRDTHQHDVVADDDRIPSDAEPWASDLLNAGERFERTFDRPGVYDYYCVPHRSWMIATVIVGRPDPAEEPGLAPPSEERSDEAGALIRAINSRTRELLDG